MYTWNEQEYKTDTWHNSNTEKPDELSHSGKLMSRENLKAVTMTVFILL